MEKFLCRNGNKKVPIPFTRALSILYSVDVFSLIFFFLSSLQSTEPPLHCCVYCIVRGVIVSVEN